LIFLLTLRLFRFSKKASEKSQLTNDAIEKWLMTSVPPINPVYQIRDFLQMAPESDEDHSSWSLKSPLPMVGSQLLTGNALFLKNMMFKTKNPKKDPRKNMRDLLFKELLDSLMYVSCWSSLGIFTHCQAYFPQLQ
jgi:hypothetical protein